MLLDLSLLEKINGVADNPGITHQVKDFNIYRHTNVAPNSFWQHVDVENEIYLPKIISEKKGELGTFIQQEQDLFFVPANNFEIKAKCIRAREGLFDGK